MAGPGAASRMSSAGRRGRRREAADASSGRCGGVGFAPLMLLLGRSNVRARQVYGRRVEGCLQAAWFVVVAVRVTPWGAVARQEVEPDESLEEGELGNSGSEAKWWERKERGTLTLKMSGVENTPPFHWTKAQSENSCALHFRNHKLTVREPKL
ncbi:hypothetical protein NDU88_004535 [Pleurodeles waltl]|uniref:Uncharacterized protein n=1 Tax=Pleurodeles waltl TaxID=8319 RepID=A0AAV7UFI8_PLEWA|nr:hypothetical protein NDU88_004535 [Pleurodeles waltl]